MRGQSTRLKRKGAMALGAITALGLIGAGCGNTQISASKAEKLVHNELNPPAQSVSCPSGVTPKKGGTFSCRVSYSDGDTATVQLHELDSNGTISADNDSLRVLTIGGGHAEDVIRRLAANGTNVQISRLTCANGVTADPGATIACHVSFADGTHALVDEHVSGTHGLLSVTPADIHAGQ